MAPRTIVAGVCAAFALAGGPTIAHAGEPAPTETDPVGDEAANDRPDREVPAGDETDDVASAGDASGEFAAVDPAGEAEPAPVAEANALTGAAEVGSEPVLARRGPSAPLVAVGRPPVPPVVTPEVAVGRPPVPPTPSRPVATTGSATGGQAIVGLGGLAPGRLVDRVGEVLGAFAHRPW